MAESVVAQITDRHGVKRNFAQTVEHLKAEIKRLTNDIGADTIDKGRGFVEVCRIIDGLNFEEVTKEEVEKTEEVTTKKRKKATHEEE